MFSQVIHNVYIYKHKLVLLPFDKEVLSFFFWQTLLGIKYLEKIC